MSFFTALGALFVAFNFLMVSFVLVLGYLEWRATRGETTPIKAAAVATPGLPPQ